jgi:hypothetical protein
VGPSLNGPPDGEGLVACSRWIVTQQFGGRLSKDWKPGGLVVHISMPLERLKA